LLKSEKQANGFYIDPLFDTAQKWCWSADCDTEESAERALFHNGKMAWQRRYYGSYVRCVRLVTADDNPQRPLKNEQASQPQVSQSTPDAPSVNLRSTPVTIPNAELRKTFELNEFSRAVTFTENHFQQQADTVVDQTTGLMWQASGSKKAIPYEEAQAYITTLNQRRFNGYDDWRLPTVPELMSLLEPEKQANRLHINPLFEATQKWCWSADRDTEESAARVLFSNSGVVWHKMSIGAYVRAVGEGNQPRFHVEQPVRLRDTLLTVSQEQSAQEFGLQGMRPRQYIENVFEDRGETVLDHVTGLLWQKAGSGLYKHKDVQTYLNETNRQRFAGYDDWRLPTIPELMSLLEQEQQTNGCFIHSLFDSAQPACWSADAHESADKTWVVYFIYGNIHWSLVQAPRYIRCVRNA
jgi:hypothetical protein